MAKSPTSKAKGKAAGRSKSGADIDAKTQQRIADLEGEVLTRLLTASMKIRIDGRTQSATVLQVIMHQVWTLTLQGDERAKARQLLMGFVSLIPRSQRTAVGIALMENDYTAAVAAKVRGDSNAG